MGVEHSDVREALRNFYAGFSLPDAEFDDALCEEISVAHARATVERALQWCPDTVRPVANQVQHALSSPLSFDDVWCRAISVTLDALKRSDPQSEADVKAVLAAWADQINNPCSRKSIGTVFYSRDRSSFELAFADSLGPEDEQFLRDQALDASHAESVIATLNAAFDLIERYAPEYGPWVQRLLKRLIPLRGGSANSCQSGSSRLDAGACHMAFPCQPEALAEMLIHEVTHQYYYLLTRIGPVEDGTDTALYFSPAKNRDRPIYFILIAYHAFANVLLFSRRCRAAGYADPRGYLQGNVRELSEWMDIFETHLTQTEALTEIGTALWQPLSRAIHSSVARTVPVASNDEATQMNRAGDS